MLYFNDILYTTDISNYKKLIEKIKKLNWIERDKNISTQNFNVSAYEYK